MRAPGRELIVGVFFIVGAQLSNLCLADEIQRSSGEGQLVEQPAVPSKPSSDGKIPVREFVNHSFPFPPSFQHFQKIRDFAKDQNTIPELKNLLKKECDGKDINERLCSNIVTTLGALGTSESLSELKVFINQGSMGSNLKALTDGIRAMGIWTNVNEDAQNRKSRAADGKDGETTLRRSDEHFSSKNSKISEVISSVLEDLIQRASTGLKKPEAFGNRTLAEISKDNDDEKIENTRSRRLRRAALQGLAFSGSKQSLQLVGEDKDKENVRQHLESLLAKAPAGTSYRAFIIELLNTHNVIAKVGLACYFEQEKGQEKSAECKERWTENVTQESTQ